MAAKRNGRMHQEEIEGFFNHATELMQKNMHHRALKNLRTRRPMRVRFSTGFPTVLATNSTTARLEK